MKKGHVLQWDNGSVILVWCMVPCLNEKGEKNV